MDNIDGAFSCLFFQFHLAEAKFSKQFNQIEYKCMMCFTTPFLHTIPYYYYSTYYVSQIELSQAQIISQI